MKPVGVVKAFFEKGSNRPVTVPEMMAFWKSCSDSEKKEFAESAAAQLGVTLDD